MTKKEKEELERKQKKSNKAKNITIIILVVLLIAIIAFFLFKEGIIPFGKESSSTSNPTNSVSDTIDNPIINNNETSNSNNETEDESTSEEPSSDTDDADDEKPNKNDGSVYSASLPLTDNDVMTILNSRYGKGYSINRSTQNGEYTNFAVTKGDERYATVSVNLSTGEAIELIVDTGKQTEFNLL